jgi:hypothetical protein
MEPADIRDRMRELRHAVRGEGGARQRPGRAEDGEMPGSEVRCGRQLMNFLDRPQVIRRRQMYLYSFPVFSYSSA